MSGSQQIIKQEQTRFSSDSQLLSELGERLIATRHVALAELIKNAYDADATRCNIWLENDNSELIIKDDGHGMTEAEFEDFWMTIATSNRDRNPKSRRYGREVQGSKGVGRFAVRNLGLFLELRTVAYDEGADEYRRLVANFDWEEFESGTGLQEMEVRYRTIPHTGPTRELSREIVAIALRVILIGVFDSTEGFESVSSVSPDSLFLAGRFEDRFSDSDRHHMLARARLELEGWTGAIRRDAALDVNRVGVFLRLIVRSVDNLDLVAFEKGELKPLPSRSFLYLFVGVEYVHHIGWGECRHRYLSM